jgi:hypothetical protein
VVSTINPYRVGGSIGPYVSLFVEF